MNQPSHDWRSNAVDEPRDIATRNDVGHSFTQLW